MKTIHRIVAAAFLCAAALGLSVAPGHAQKPPAVILIVNFNQLFTESTVAKDVIAQVEKQADALETENERTTQGFIDEARKLNEQRELLGQETFRQRAEELQKRRQQHQASMQRKMQALQIGQAKAQQEVEAVLRPIFAEVMKKHGGTIVLDQATVLAGGVDLNVTAEIIQLLNERMKSVKVTPVDPSTLRNNQ